MRYPFIIATSLVLVVSTATSGCTPQDEVISCPPNAPVYDPVAGNCRPESSGCPDGQHDDGTGNCVDDVTVNCPPGTPIYDPVTESCRAEGDTGGTDGSDGSDGIVDMDAGSLADSVAEDAGPQVAEDAGGAEDIKIDGQCNPLVDPMNLGIGNPCDDHADCATCYCYDEAYLSPFRFCTKNCSSGAGSSCSDEDPNNPNKFKCLKFTAKHVNDYDLNVGGICMPRCDSNDECKIYGPDYQCPDQNQGTKWEGYTVQVDTTCQTPM